MDSILQVTLLYDFYGVMLTDKQKLVFEMYHLNDLSLQEISEELGVSRQAVRDLISRTQKILENYEEKLMLLKRFLEQKQAAEHAISEIDCLLQETLSQKTVSRLCGVKNDLLNILLIEQE